MTSQLRSLTGIKPTGTPHLGNYLGSIKPALELATQYQALYFIADYHALTTVHDGATLSESTYDVAATWLALGLDPESVIFYRQSDVSEIFELTWILDCFAPKGLLNRAHAYKAAVARNEELDRDADAGISGGLYNYPVLMAADILLFSSNVVPVGLDQKQHVEIARDIAEALNRNYKQQLFVLPEPRIDDDVKTITGTDGRKMSKSYDNVVPIFGDEGAIKKVVMRITTDSKTVEEPKDPDTCNVFTLFRHFAAPQQVDDLAARYRAGGMGYGDAKKELLAVLVERFAEPRERYLEFMADRSKLDEVLERGAERAREIAVPMLERVRAAVGTSHRAPVRQ